MKIHKSRKHTIIEQIDGNASIAEHADDEEMSEFYKEFDEDVELYLKTGKMGSDGALWDCIMYNLKRHSSDPGKELLLALEARRTAIEEEGFGDGSYMKAPPWDEIFNF